MGMGAPDPMDPKVSRVIIKFPGTNDPRGNTAQTELTMANALLLFIPMPLSCFCLWFHIKTTWDRSTFHPDLFLLVNCNFDLTFSFVKTKYRKGFVITMIMHPSFLGSHPGGEFRQIQWGKTIRTIFLSFLTIVNYFS